MELTTLIVATISAIVGIAAFVYTVSRDRRLQEAKKLKFNFTFDGFDQASGAAGQRSCTFRCFVKYMQGETDVFPTRVNVLDHEFAVQNANVPLRIGGSKLCISSRPICREAMMELQRSIKHAPWTTGVFGSLAFENGELLKISFTAAESQSFVEQLQTMIDEIGKNP